MNSACHTAISWVKDVQTMLYPLSEIIKSTETQTDTPDSKPEDPELESEPVPEIHIAQTIETK